MANAIPEGMHTLTAQLNIDGCGKAIEWYKQALGAEELSRAPDPSGQKIWHASMRIGGSVFFCNDVFPGMTGDHGGHASLWLYTPEADALFARATGAGATVKMPMTDMFWGDRMGTVIDPFGHQWTIAQHVKDMTPEETKKAQDAFVASMKK